MVSVNSANNANIYNKFSNVNYSNNREFLTSTYGPKPQYYQTEAEKNKEEKNIIIRTAVIIATTIGAGLCAYKNRAKLRDISQKIAEKFKDSSLYKKITKSDKLTKLKEGLDNLSNNFSNVKDDAYDSIREKLVNSKHKPISWIGKKLTAMGDTMANLYYKILKDATESEYKKAYKELEDLGIADRIDNFDTWFDNLRAEVEKVHNNNERITSGFLENKKYKEIGKKTFANELLNSSDELKKLKTGINTNNLTQKQKDAIAAFNEVRNSMYEKLVPKIRDIAWGNAATDTIVSSASLIPLVWSIAGADTEEERKDTALNLGIPLVSGIAMNVVSTMKACSGAVGMIVGFVGGKVITTSLTKLFDMLQEKKTENKIVA